MDTSAHAMAAEHSARLENLPRFMSFIDEACRRAHADDEATFALRLAVEEVCINLIRYGYKDMLPGPIKLSFTCRPGEITVTIRDHARPFDPSQAPAPDLGASLESRPIGGLGWYLVKQFVDRIDYQSDPKLGNELVLTKRAAGACGPDTSSNEGESSGTVR